MKKVKEIFCDWTRFDFAWFIIANLIILAVSIYLKNDPISIVSAITGVCCVIFISKKMIANYYVGIINVSLYAYLAFQSRLFGDFMLNAFYYLPMQFVGIYTWKKAIKSNHIESKSLSSKQKINLLIYVVALIIAYSYLLYLIGGNLVVIDATSTVLSVIAMFLMINQYTEQWYLWVIVNSISIIMWAISLSQGSGNHATLFMWVVYLLNSLFGLYNWKKNIK